MDPAEVPSKRAHVHQVEERLKPLCSLWDEVPRLLLRCEESAAYEGDRSRARQNAKKDPESRQTLGVVVRMQVCDPGLRDHEENHESEEDAGARVMQIRVSGVGEGGHHVQTDQHQHARDEGNIVGLEAHHWVEGVDLDETQQDNSEGDRSAECNTHRENPILRLL